MYDVSIIIPAFNEARRITPTLEQFDEFLRDSQLRYEIIVVDDGSADDTVAVVRAVAENMPALSCLESKPNHGKGYVVRKGMLAARGRIRVMVDADGSTPAWQLPRLIGPVQSGDVAVSIGSRYTRGASVDRKQPFYRRWWSRFANQVVQWTLVRGVVDTQCGFKAFRDDAAKQVFSRAQIDGWAFDLEALALAKRMDFGILEVAVHWSDDPRSKINPLKDAWNVAKELVSIRRNLNRGVYGLLPAASASTSRL